MSQLVSVVIPCYKQAHYLTDAVESVVKQTYTNWECIIVNDGSPDNTSEVANGLIAKYPDQDIKLIEKENGGLADARNAGIAQANGEYIQPLDSDDILKEEYLELMLTELEKGDSLNAVYCLQQNFGESDLLRTPPEFDPEKLLLDNCMLCSTLFKKELWEKVGGYYTGIPWGSEDWNFWISCIPYGLKAKRVDQGLFLYRVSKESMFSKMIDYMGEVRSFIKTLHPNLYSKDQLDSAYISIMNMKEETLKKIQEINSKFSEDEYLYFWFAIYLEGQRKFSEAEQFYKKSLQCLALKNKNNAQIERKSFELESKIKAQTTPTINGPLISVIVPTFNRKESLEIALKSIVEQSYQNIEIVVVNDCGDDVESVVEDLCLNKEVSYKYIAHTINKGLAAARNTGIKNASADYIAYLDDDDFYYENHLSALMTYMQSINADVVYSDANVCVQEKTEEGYKTVARQLFVGSDFSIEQLLVGNFIPVQCFLHKKLCIEEAGFFDESLKFFEDWDLWIRMAEKFDFKHLPIISSEFYQRRDSTSMSGAERRADKRRELIYKKYKEIAQRYPGVVTMQKKTLLRVKRELMEKLENES